MIDSNQNNVPRKPALVETFSWLIFLQGLLSLLLTLWTALLLISYFPIVGSLVGFPLIAMTAIISLLDIILSFSIRRMKRWALYTFTFLTVLQIVPMFVKFDAKAIVILVINVGMTIYLLSISKKFV